MVPEERLSGKIHPGRERFCVRAGPQQVRHVSRRPAAGGRQGGPPGAVPVSPLSGHVAVFFPERERRAAQGGVLRRGFPESKGGYEKCLVCLFFM